MVTVPFMMLVGSDGKVISANIQAAEIEDGLEKLQARQASKPQPGYFINSGTESQLWSARV